ncbi:GGDEF/EAL domain-containing response regulator [Denitromonas ohlonensis]|uniref:EAL domain-containing protein n=2 Tax=Denitromonas TaxID=139331 RepID=A0A557SP77_9RHOO|nr:EAL domain-containing protein [Denitromonas ohlonensis]TVO67156.1 EAL domain-containing protein [Denitromonas ohlonensis]TVO79216.1 EAL domain-containing protein [Denitromonas ohlonensis]
MATIPPDSRETDALIGFRDEDHAPAASPSNVWRILAVDDDQGFQQALAHALRDLHILGRPLELLQAYSLSEAAHLLGKDRDFAVILADVVMETEDAGLRLVKGVREMLGLHEPRIVLLTGQPGFAPVDEVMETYDLSDYCLKSDLASRGLKNVLTAAIRSYSQLSAVSSARKGLQLILEASNRLTAARTIEQIASAVLVELADLLKVPAEGIVCVEGLDGAEAAPAAEPVIIGAAGRFEAYLKGSLMALPDRSIADSITAALTGRHPIARDDFQVLYFPRQHAMADYAVYLATGRPLVAAEHELLGVFAANASKGFGNVALISRLDRMAYEDELLHIPNRAALLREIERLRIGKNGGRHRMLLIDLDNFSGLNDAFGVALGNRILGALIEPLRQAFPPPAMLARVTADLFAVIGPAEQIDSTQAMTVFEQPLRLDNTLYRLTACTTELTLDAVAGNADELLRAAWTSLRAAKQRGPGTRVAYDPDIERQAGERFALMSRLGQDLQRDALFLVFQPQVCLSTGRIVGAEALLRWRTDAGLIPPGEFIPVAEKSVYIHAIGDRVVQQACEALKAIDAAGLNDLPLSVNVSARQFDAPGLAERVAAHCAEAGVELHRLALEITETAAMRNFSQVAQALRAHRAAGGIVAIDDFGTGQSSLEYLRDLPADHLKIDLSFVRHLEQDERCRQIASMIIKLGRSLGVGLIAEGVETRGQADWLRDNGCQTGQGWLFAKPLPLPEFIDFCRQHAELG